jgi:hypothetical protein
LRIHYRRFARGNSEKTRIERAQLEQKSGAAACGFAGNRRIRVEDGVNVPAFRRNFDDALTTASKEFPKCVSRFNAAWKLTPYADDRDPIA